MREKSTRIAKSTAETYRAEVDVNVTKCFPSVINDEAMSELARKSIGKIWGEDSLIQVPSSMGNDDFAFYITEKPGVYVFIGTGDPDTHTDIPHHNPHFKVDEDQMAETSAFMMQFVFDYLGEK